MRLEQQQEPRFSQPTRQIALMLLVLTFVGAGSFLAFPAVSPLFIASPYLNGIILVVFGVGVAACFWQVTTLISSVSWIEGFALDRPGHEFIKSPRLLASLSALLGETRARKALTSMSSRTILDSVATRLDEARDITRYIVSLLIFLGLLGTFYGLATTVPAVVDTIRSLAPQEGQSAIESFDNLMSGLEKQLGGMGTAFSTSLLGLAGSLIVGLLELFAGHGQNRFYREMEEWLSSITRIGFASADGEETGSAASGLAELMEQSAARLETLTDIIENAEDKRLQTDKRLGALSESIGSLADQMAARKDPVSAATPDPEVFQRLAASQEQMVEGQSRMAAAQQQMVDGHSRMVAAQEKMAEGHARMAAAQEQLAEGQTRMAAAQEQLLAGQERGLTAQMQGAEMQQRLVEAQDKVAELLQEGVDSGGGMDSEARMRLRNIDVQLLRILEEMAAGRQDTLAELRQDLAAVVQSIRDVAMRQGR